MPIPMDFVSTITGLMQRHSLEHFGFAALERPLSMDFYREWLEDGHHAGMEYLASHAPLKEDPSRFAPRAKSAIVVAKSYAKHPYPQLEFPKALRTSLYSRGEDYHIHFRQELEALAETLRVQFPNEEFLCFTDSAPILERDLAYRAGVGWFGKNTCLIHPEHGSLFFIGQILTSIDINAKPNPVPDHCGTCDRCIRACPTGAIESPRKLNSNKCLSYWTIEARENAPPEIRTKTSSWFFGCDICQTVCPWNEKVFGREEMRNHSEFETDAQVLHEDLRWVLLSSNKEIERKTFRSPLSRPRPMGLKRNALVVIGNLKIQELRPEVERALNEPRLNDLAQWTLNQLT